MMEQFPRCKYKKTNIIKKNGVGEFYNSQNNPPPTPFLVV